MIFLVLESTSSRILFHYGVENCEEEVIQLVTPILVSQRLLQEELRSQVHEIQLGTNILQFICHSFAGTEYNLIVQGSKKNYQQIKGKIKFFWGKIDIQF